jgi:proteasome lid subunit RPN8/RPN11
LGIGLESRAEISRRALDAVIAHARGEAPRECCGLLVGQAASIRDAVAARNLAAAATRFLVDPQDHIDAMRAARGRGLEIVGFYHSHPHTSPVPSPTDRAEATYPGHLYLIVGLAGEGPDVRLFRLVDGNFLEVRFVTVD